MLIVVNIKVERNPATTCRGCDRSCCTADATRDSSWEVDQLMYLNLADAQPAKQVFELFGRSKIHRRKVGKLRQPGGAEASESFFFRLQ